MQFRNEYYFLSNMYPCHIKYGKQTYRCAEALFQSFKCRARAEEFAQCNGYQAKKLGRQVLLPQDWSEHRDEFMLMTLRMKFGQSPELRQKLLAVEGEIVEDNHWHDTYWGVCRGVGENRLGQLLMQVREEMEELDAAK